MAVSESVNLPAEIVPVRAALPPIEPSSYDGDTAMKLYLREIGQVKLLTPEVMVSSTAGAV